MKIFSEIRSRCRALSEPRTPWPDDEVSAVVHSIANAWLAVLALATLAILSGCTDDVVCGEEVPPYIAARVEQSSAARAGSTYVEVYCVSDPLPGQLLARVSGDTLPGAQEAAGLPGLSTTFSDTQVIWQPGTGCVLEVTTDTGSSSALETVPGSFEVAAPGTVGLGDELTLSWTASSEADYYLVRGTIAGAQSEMSLDIAVDGNSITLGPSDVGLAGVLSGHVWAVSGPFPQTGSDGNVTGEGWGYFSVMYRVPATEFTVAIEDTARAASKVSRALAP